MMRIATALLFAALGLTAFSAQARDVPVERDVKRERRIEREAPPANPNLTPDNPDGVVGFDGPADPADAGVDGGGPLPPGSPGNIDND